MFPLRVFFVVFVTANSIKECFTLTFVDKISKEEVNGENIKFCQYKLMKMSPKSTIADVEACLLCECRTKGLICKDIDNKPGCKLMPGGQFPQNPFDDIWKDMVDAVIDSKYAGKHRALQIKTQIVAGTVTYMKLLVKDRLCDLNIFTNLKQEMEVTEDSCGLEKMNMKKQSSPKTVNEVMMKIKKKIEERKFKKVNKTFLRRTKN